MISVYQKLFIKRYPRDSACIMLRWRLLVGMLYDVLVAIIPLLDGISNRQSLPSVACEKCVQERSLQHSQITAVYYLLEIRCRIARSSMLQCHRVATLSS